MSLRFSSNVLKQAVHRLSLNLESRERVRAHRVHYHRYRTLFVLRVPIGGIRKRDFFLRARNLCLN